MTLSFLTFTPSLYAETEHLNEHITLKGDFIQGGLVFGGVKPGSQVVFDGKKIRLSPDGDFIIGFHRDEPGRHILKITLPDGQKLEKNITIRKREYNIQRINGLPQSKVSPRKPEVLARIKNESTQASQARKRDDDRTDFLESFIWPTKGPISGVYGSQRILNGKPRNPHFGVDVAVPTGTDVVAPASGVVTLAHPDMFYSGGTLVLDHGHGLSSTFLHLSKLLVKTDDQVKQGDLIAQVGATGRVTGAHLDWRMNLFKRRVDPQLLVP
ncbi:MAG: M23 family metallopeptidase, partial [Gammaproteobacteria bacterium]|nr:M23 family metallopeptidase [Gammaproteobacteria bacterium]